MNTLWLKVQIWTKIVLGVLIALYLAFFLYNNTGKSVQLWFLWTYTPYQTGVLTLVVLVFLLGVLSVPAAWVAWRTIRQIRDLRHRREAAAEQKQADLEAKASMLQTKPEPEEQQGM